MDNIKKILQLLKSEQKKIIFAFVPLTLLLVIFETLRKYIHTFKYKEISINEKNFGNISIITQAFQRCYLKKKIQNLLF